MELVSTMEINGEEREIADAYAREQIATNAQNIATNAEGIAGLNNNLDTLSYSDEHGGNNIFRNYDDMGNYSFIDETYNGYPVIYSKYQWGGAKQKDIVLKNGKYYTVSAYVKGSGEVGLYYGRLHATEFRKTLTSDWQKVVWTFSPDSNTADTGGNSGNVRIEQITSGCETYIACFQIEEGRTATDYEPYIPSVKILSADVDGLKSDLASQSKVVEKHDKIINTPNVATVSGMSYNSEADEIVLNLRTEPDETLADRVSWHDNALNGIYDTMTALKEKTDSDLGGLKFSASGTTLTITDGTNTWRLTAN